MEETAYWLGLAGALALGLAIGIQLLLNVLMLLGQVQPSPAMIASWSMRGQTLIKPERELAMFAGGIIAIMGLMLAFAALWIRRLRRATPEDRRRAAWTLAIHQSFLAAGSLALYFIVLWNRFPLLPGGARGDVRVAVGDYAKVLLFLPAALGIACALIDLSPRFSRQTRRASRFAMAGRFILELALPALAVLSVFIPPSQWRLLAGWFLQLEALHHWSYYAMAPAHAYVHGKAFFADFYSQYGIGWPLLYATFFSRPLTFSGLIGMGIVYGCAYMAGVYLLARVLFRDVVWAGIATMLVLMLRMYPWYAPETLWRLPSLTVLRHAADVWFLLALVLHERRGGLGWLILAGATCGAGLCFGTDTGIYLLVTLGVYGFAVALRKGVRRAGATVGVALAEALIIVFALAWFANRGRFPGPAFWHGWIESIRVYAIGGMAMLPMASVEDFGLGLFFAFVIVYLSAIAIGAVHVLNRRESAQSASLALIASYGMVQMLSFVGHSGTGILYAVSVPFAIVLVGLMQQLRETVRTHLRLTAVPVAMLFMAVVMHLTRHEFTVAPTLLSRRPYRAAIPLNKDMEIPADAPKAAVDFLRQTMQVLPKTVRRLAVGGSDVAVLDTWAPVFYVVADVRPWPRYPDPVSALATRAMLEQAKAELIKRHPQYVLMRHHNYGGTQDVWDAHQQILSAGLYTRVNKKDGSVAGFDVWRYTGHAATTRPATEEEEPTR